MDDLGGILAFCNEVRQKLGRQPVPKLRKGIMWNPHQCVVAGTINYRARNRYTVDNISVTSPGLNVAPVAKTPAWVGEFLIDFDLGQRPELVGEGWAE